MLYEELDELLTTGSRVAIRSWMVRAFEWFDSHATMVRAWQEIWAYDPAFRVMPLYFIANHMPKYLAQWPSKRRQAARLRVVLMVNQLADTHRRAHIREQLDVEDDLLIDTLTDLWISALRADFHRV